MFETEIDEYGHDHPLYPEKVRFLAHNLEESAKQKESLEKARDLGNAATCWRSLRELDRALFCINKALELVDSDSRQAYVFYIRKAHILQWQLQFEAANLLFKSVVRDCPRDLLHFALQHRAKCYLDQARYHEANLDFLIANRLRFEMDDSALLESTHTGLCALLKNAYQRDSRQILVLIEGIPGAGKTTTTRNLAARMRERTNQSWQFWFESSIDCPVGYLWSFEKANQLITESDLERYPFETWLDLDSSYPTIMESKFLQNTSLYAMIRGESPEQCLEYPRQILSFLRNEWKVIWLHLACSDPQARLDEVIPQREQATPEWFPFVSKLFKDSVWGKRYKVEQNNAFETAMLDWQGMLTDFGHTPMECLKVEFLDPFNHWSQSLDRMEALISAACGSQP